MFRLFRGGKAGRTGEDERTPISDVRYVVVDTELTGLDEKKDDIVSIGALRLTGGRMHVGAPFYRLVSPQKRLTAESVVIHEITPSDVELKPGIETALREFLDFCGDDVLIGHFISIDLGFLNREMKRLFGRPLPNSAVDTYSVYSWLRQRHKASECFSSALTGYRLYDIVGCFGIPVNGAHNALRDAYTTGELFQRFLPLLAEAGVLDLGDLLRIGIPFEGGEGSSQPGEFSNF